ncbi:hypothetical protein ACSMXN_05645 [Jatrophihabitans sp. DSM 45814]
MSTDLGGLDPASVGSLSERLAHRDIANSVPREGGITFSSALGSIAG